MADDRPDRIVVGVSGSVASLAALRAAIELARRTAGTVEAVIAWEPPEGAAGTRRVVSVDDLTEIYRRAATARLREAFERIGWIPEDDQIQRHVIQGRPGPALLGLATQESDTLVIGAGNGSWMRRWSNQVNRYVMSHHRCTVLIAPLPELAYTPQARVGLLGRRARARLNIPSC